MTLGISSRTRRWAGRKWAALGVAVVGLAIVAATGSLAVNAAFNDSGTVNIQVNDRTGAVIDATTAGGAFVSYIGDSNTSFGSSGTGVFVPFVRLQGSPTEQGYNTNGTTEFDTKVGTWTHAMLVSQIPQRPCPQTGPTLICFELWNDVNENNSTPYLSLNKVEVYFATGPGAATLTGYDTTNGGFPNAPAGTTVTAQYAFAGDIVMKDVNQGSGRGDLRYDIPINGSHPITVPANCYYGSSTCTTYFVLYSKWGTTPSGAAPLNHAYASDGGFEEWKVKTYPFPKTPSISTTLSETSGAIGDTVHDSATLTGASSGAGGTVSYAVYSDSTCTTLLASLGTKTVTSAVVPDSDNYGPITNAGDYYFQATYSGDINNVGPVSSTCTSEHLVIAPNTPSIATTLSETSGAIGDSVHDSATLTGETATAGGTVKYAYYSDTTTCAAGTYATPGGTSAGSKTVTNGVVPDSDSVTFSNAGTYYWRAFYSGDSNNSGPVSSACADEVLVIAPNTPSVSSTPVVQIKDTISITGFAAPAAGAPDVLVGLYTSATCTTGQVGSNTSFAVPAAGGTVSGATTFVGVLADTYYFKISYAGDANNDSFSSCTESVGVTIVSVP